MPPPEGAELPVIVLFVTSSDTGATRRTRRYRPRWFQLNCH